MDMPHRSSKWRNQFSENFNATNGMFSLYQQFQKELALKYKNHTHLNICPEELQEDIYEPVSIS